MHPTTYPIGTKYRVAGPHWSLGWHTGVDYLTPTGTPLYAATAGRVTNVDLTSSYGWRVGIEGKGIDGKTYRHYVCHMAARGIVTPGERVAAGQLLGYSGATGNVTGPHCHFEVRRAPYTFAATSFANPEIVTGEKPMTKPDYWYRLIEWNLAGFDLVHGRDSWDSRIPKIIKRLASYKDLEVVCLLEVPDGKLADLKTRLAAIGLKIASGTDGRYIACRQDIKVGRTFNYTLPTRGPADDDKQATYAELELNPTTLIACGHLEYRDGPTNDTARVLQAREEVAKLAELGTKWGISPSRRVAVNDENSNTLVSTDAMAPSMADSFDIAPDTVNESTATFCGWSGLAPTGWRIDKVHVHVSRPVRRAKVVKTYAKHKLSDHLPTVVTLGK